jgi:hypothetical protein
VILQQLLHKKDLVNTSFPFIKKQYSEQEKNIIVIITFIFYSTAVVKQDHYWAHLLRLCKYHFVIQPVQNPPLCSSTSNSMFSMFILTEKLG